MILHILTILISACCGCVDAISVEVCHNLIFGGFGVFILLILMMHFYYKRTQLKTTEVRVMKNNPNVQEMKPTVRNPSAVYHLCADHNLQSFVGCTGHAVNPSDVTSFCHRSLALDRH